MALYMIDYFDREPEASSGGLYAEASIDECKGFVNRTGKRVPKASAKAEAGVGRANAAVGVVEVEAKGPNAKAVAQASLYEVSAMAGAELGSVSGKAGPVDAKLGLGIKTGGSIGIEGVEAKVLGCGFKFGPKMAVSVFGSEIGFSWL